MHDRTQRSRQFWTPRPPLDPTLRLRFHGPIEPMEKPSLLARLLGIR